MNNKELALLSIICSGIISVIATNKIIDYWEKQKRKRELRKYIIDRLYNEEGNLEKYYNDYLENKGYIYGINIKRENLNKFSEEKLKTIKIVVDYILAERYAIRRVKEREL